MSEDGGAGFRFRKSPRVPHRARVELLGESSSEALHGETVNISAEGMFVASEAPPQVGARVTFEVTIDEGVIKGIGDIVWRRLAPRDDTDQRSGFGLVFRYLDPTGRERLTSFLNAATGRRDPLAAAARQQPAAEQVARAAGANQPQDSTPEDEAQEVLRHLVGTEGAAESATREPSEPPPPLPTPPPPEPPSVPAGEDQRGPSPAERADLQHQPDGPRSATQPPSRPAAAEPPSRPEPSDPTATLDVPQTPQASRWAVPATIAVLLATLLLVWFAIYGRGPAPEVEDPTAGVSREDEDERQPTAAAPDADPQAARQGTGEGAGEGAPGDPEAAGPAVMATSSRPLPAELTRSPTADVAPARSSTYTSLASRIDSIRADRQKDRTLIQVLGNGAFRPEALASEQLGGEQPRYVIRISGIEEPYVESIVTVDSEQVVRVRTGFHPGDDVSLLHLVVDLSSADAQVDLEIDGDRLLLEVI